MNALDSRPLRVYVPPRDGFGRDGYPGVCGLKKIEAAAADARRHATSDLGRLAHV